MKHPFAALFILLILIARAACGEIPGGGLQTVDPELPPYQVVPGISGTLDSIGSDSLNNLMTLWAEAFQVLYPNVTIQIEGKGSSTAPPALIEGTAQLGPMSRLMKRAEIDRFEAHFGYEPYRIAVALDTLAIYVHRENPLPGITLEQLDGLFSMTRKRGHAPLRTWGDLGLPAPRHLRSISLYGRNSASGTYGFFKDKILANGDFRQVVKELPGSSSVVHAVSSDPQGIGYSGIGYRTSGVRILPVATGNGSFIHPTHENCLSGDYPIARLLHLYINKPPYTTMRPLIREFLKFILSREGQAIVVRDGYYPLPAEVAGRYLEAIERQADPQRNLLRKN